jgi:transposase InsO family protein
MSCFLWRIYETHSTLSLKSGCDIFFLQEKSQTQETLKRFLRWAQNEFGLRIKNIRSNNGTEFKNSQIEGFLKEEGIKHDFSSSYTPQQNDVVER